jgi:hypothetical protein
MTDLREGDVAATLEAAALEQVLQQRGWQLGINLRIEYR